MAERVLVVEDEPLIAFDVADHLREAGFEVAGPAASVPAALKLLEAGGCDLAVLDVNLGRETAAPIAAALAARSLPFIALSGYSSGQFPAGFENAPVLTKPVDPKQLVAELRRLLGR
ncbi:MAG: response regulator [Rhodomicrobium sp.]|jgi:DNA-binding response OmpR family regulator